MSIMSALILSTLVVATFCQQASIISQPVAAAPQAVPVSVARPVAPATSVAVPRCPANSYYTSCGTACPRSCQNPLVMYRCIERCVPGCFCNPGYLKDDATGACIPEARCYCPANSVYSGCSSACPETCQRGRPQVCVQVCRAGCTCRSGYVIDEYSGQCVPRNYCYYYGGYFGYFRASPGATARLR